MNRVRKTARRWQEQRPAVMTAKRATAAKRSLEKDVRRRAEARDQRG